MENLPGDDSRLIHVAFRQRSILHLHSLNRGAGIRSVLHGLSTCRLLRGGLWKCGQSQPEGGNKDGGKNLSRHGSSLKSVSDYQRIGSAGEEPSRVLESEQVTRKVRPTSRHATAPLAVVGYPEIFAVWKLAPPLFLRIVFE